MIWYTIVGIVIVVVSYFVMTRQRRRPHQEGPSKMMTTESTRIADAREKVATLVANGRLIAIGGAATSNALMDDVGPITKEFFLKYPSVQNKNGGLRLSVDQMRPSEYMPGWISIGNSEDWDVVVQPGHDQVLVLEGSEEGPEDTDLKFSTVYHFIVQDLYQE